MVRPKFDRRESPEAARRSILSHLHTCRGLFVLTRASSNVIVPWIGGETVETQLDLGCL
jgi:hypothetical protein